MARDTAPAIRSSWSEQDVNVSVIENLGTDMSTHPGIGSVGTRVQRVEHDCPRCESDEMYRSVDVGPEGPDGVCYYCTNFECPHFVGDALDRDAGRYERRADEPTVWDNTAVCPDCGTWHTVEVHFWELDHYDWGGEPGRSKVINQACDACLGGDV